MNCRVGTGRRARPGPASGTVAAAVRPPLAAGVLLVALGFGAITLLAMYGHVSQPVSG